MRFGRNILILSALALFLAAGLLTERLMRPGRAVDAGVPLFPVAPEAIVAIEWEEESPTGATRPMALRREGELWHLATPYAGALCDAAAMADFLDAALAMRVSARLGPAEGSAFRVTRRLTLRTADGAYTRGFGGAQPMALAQTLAEADGALVSVEAAQVARLPKRAATLRTRAALPVPAERVTALEWRAPGQPFTRAQRLPNGNWAVSRPFPFEVEAKDAGRVPEALTAAHGILAYVRPADDAPPPATDRALPEAILANYGLDEETALRLSVYVRGLGRPLTLRFGRADPDREGAVFCLLDDGRSVVSVPGALAAAFGAEGPFVATAREFVVFGEAAEATRLTVRLRGQETPVTLALANGLWRLTLPMSLPADAVAARGLLARLAGLVGEVTGIEPPAGQDPLCVLTLGEPRPGETPPALALYAGASADTLLAWRTDRRRLYRVARANVPAGLLEPGLQHALADRTVLSVPAAQIRRLAVLRRDGSGCAVRRAGAALTWSTESPVGAYVDTATVDAWLTRFADLKADHVLRDAPVALGALRPYGLERPLLRLTLDLDGAEEGLRRVLLIGDPDPETGEAPALIQGRPILYALDADTVRLLLRSPVKETPKP